jgi:hypothetical protein
MNNHIIALLRRSTPAEWQLFPDPLACVRHMGLRRPEAILIVATRLEPSGGGSTPLRHAEFISAPHALSRRSSMALTRPVGS